MSSTSTIPASAPPTAVGNASSGLLISLSPLGPDALEATLSNIAAAFPTQTIEVTTPDPTPTSSPANLRLSTYTPSVSAPGGWILTAADYLNTYKRMQETQSTACLQLGPEAQSLTPESLRALTEALAAGPSDLATPNYALGPRDALVNSAILYPVTRALFGTRPHYPLAIDLAFSNRMAERLATCAQRLTATNQSAGLIWPISEAATSSFPIAEVPAVARALPPPNTIDLNSVLALVAGSFFADLEAKASFWQRSRLAYSPKAGAAPSDPIPSIAATAEASEPPDVQHMLDSFRLAYTNLQEIWSLVLPPNSLLGLKKLSLMQPSAFRMPDALWVRIVYDFVLAYRLRTINRGHLLGALTPLYLAWVASHLLLTSAPSESSPAETMAPQKHIEVLAAAFETDKPYLVARWRWPDRFNP